MIYLVSPGGTREKGGMGRVVDNIVAELVANHPQVRVRVIDTYGPGAFGRMPPYFAAACARLAAALAGGRVQLVHVHMAEYGSVLRKGTVMALARAFRVPVVLHLHAGRITEQFRAAGPLQRRFLRGVFELADEVVVLGGVWHRFVAEEVAPRSTRITVLRNAVPGPATVPARDAVGPVRLLFLGRLVPIKGLHVLLEALASPPLRERPWTLTLAGDGERARYEAMVRDLGLDSRVRFTGWLDQEGCRRELAAADVLVQPSLFEGLPMAILEAMAHGLPILATTVGAVAEAVTHDDTGLLVPAGDAAALGHALARLIDDAGMRARLGAAARARFERHFALPAYGRALVEIYRRNARHWPADPAGGFGIIEDTSRP